VACVQLWWKRIIEKEIIFLSNWELWPNGLSKRWWFQIEEKNLVKCIKCIINEGIIISNEKLLKRKKI
jgi:hypothetical protein